MIAESELTAQRAVTRDMNCGLLAQWLEHSPYKREIDGFNSLTAYQFSWACNSMAECRLDKAVTGVRFSPGPLRGVTVKGPKPVCKLMGP